LALALVLATAACAAAPTEPRAPCPACDAQPGSSPTTVESAPKSRLEPPAIIRAFEQLLTRIERARCDDVFATFNDNMQKALGAERTKRICLDLSKAGPFARIELTKLSGRTGEFKVFGNGAELHSSVTLDEAGRIAGLYFRPPPPPPAPVLQTKTTLRLPFEGVWNVVWGGDNLTDNKHLSHKNQQRASDLLIHDASGKSHTGDGKKNSDYFAYGKKVLAAGDGVVETVIDGVPDNAPGVMNGYIAVGNAVIIKHRDGEYSLYAHLSPGSIRVKPKAKVRAGQLLGLCGNSGNTSEPHIHFHVQDRADLATAVGVEPVFGKVQLVRAGAEIAAESYTFKKGDQIAAP
jgi:murein DD-endopeptidase MepM/ murein hydrolase activator NlpD